MDDSTTDFNYDMIIGHDLLKEFGNIHNFGAGTMFWYDAAVPVEDPDASMEKSYHIWDNPADPVYDHVQHIMDEKYCNINACMHLMLTEHNQLYILLKKFEELFDDTLDTWT